jgi:N-acetylneuraminic acid mutarotase
MNLPRRIRLLLLAVAFCGLYGSAEAQNATLTITNNGPNSGAVGVQPGGNVCNPNPGGGGGGAPCTFSYPIGTPLRLMANSPSTPGIFNNGTGDALGCGMNGTSVCEFILNGNSSITATFDAAGGPFPSLTINLVSHGGGKGNVGTDNNQCQDFELGFSACTTYYGAGSSVRLQGRSMPGNIFAGFSNGTVDAGGCAGTENCHFTLSDNSTVDATFAALSSVAISPSSATTNVGNSVFFAARATFTNGMQRDSFNGSTPWQSHVQMDAARFSLAAEVVDNKLYAFGGVDGFCPSGGGSCPFSPKSTVDVFDPLVTLIAEFPQAWTSRAPMTIPRGSLASAVVGGRIYAIGGHTSGGATVASMESYDPSTNAWSTRDPMSGPRAGMAAAVVNTIIYVVGGSASAGSGGSTPLNTVEAFDAANDEWLTTAPPAMQVARHLPAAAAVNGILYVIGGDGTGSVEAFDPAGGSWTMKAPMPGGGGSHKAVALNGLIYVVGGSPVTVKVYNPALNAWTTLSSTSQQPSGQFALAVLDGRLFAAGGNLSDNTAVTALLANRPPEATWWSHNTAVGQINSGNSGSVSGLAAGTATISARLVTFDTGGNVPSGGTSATLTVTSGGGGGSTIFVNGPNQAFTQVGQANWGCGTFNQNAPGPWTVTVDYGEGGGVEPMPFTPDPPMGTCSSPTGISKGVFYFNHAYSAPGTYHVVVTVRNTVTNATGTHAFDVEVEVGGGGGGACVPIVSNISVIGTVPFDRVHVAVFDRVTGQLLTDDDTALPLGFFDDASLPDGQYRFEFSVPAGYQVTPAILIVDAVCGEPININLTVQEIAPDPPSISVAPSTNTLWPPNKKMVTITIDVVTSGPQGHPVSVELVSITSSEPGGENDVAGAAFGTDDRVFQLRAKRLGGGPGRVYTVTYRVTDTVTGLSSTATTTIVVPHDQGQ